MLLRLIIEIVYKKIFISFSPSLSLSHFLFPHQEQTGKHRRMLKFPFLTRHPFIYLEKYVSDARDGESRSDGSVGINDDAHANVRDTNHIITPSTTRILSQYEPHDESPSSWRAAEWTHTWCELQILSLAHLKPFIRERVQLDWWRLKESFDLFNAFPGSHHSAMAAAVAAASLHPDQDTDPRELEAFAERFKQRRIKLGKYSFKILPNYSAIQTISV